MSVDPVAAAPASTRTSLLRTLAFHCGRPWFAYLSLALLQSKRLWAIWRWRDMTSGDTTHYLRAAHGWHDRFAVDMIWSPLYTACYGSLLHVTEDAYAVTILHRVLIVLGLALLVLALMRRLLPPVLAWLVAAWWAVLPVNFDALYEVHLFALLPVLGAWILVLARDDRLGRGGALAVVCAASVLVRNELAVAAGLLGLCFTAWEVRLARVARAGGAPAPRWRDYRNGYVLPLLAAGLACLFFYSRDARALDSLRSGAALKHSLNMCQVYAFGYRQRHPEWTRDPWTECHDLMAATFGDRLPSLTEMIRRNPRAVAEHFLWNIGLTPDGLQILLFSAASGGRNPDYVPVRLGARAPLVLGVLLLGIVTSGGALLCRERRYWWGHWLRRRAGGWLAMFAVAAVAVPVILTQRPRPSYLFSLGVVIMAVTGMCAFALLRRLSLVDPAARTMPVIALAVIVLTPPFYPRAGHGPSRPLLRLYRRLVPFERDISRPGTVLLVSGYADDISNLIARQPPGRGPVRVYGYNIVGEAAASGEALTATLARYGVNLFYVNERMWQRLRTQAQGGLLLEPGRVPGWRTLALHHEPDGRWMLLRRRGPP